MATRDVQNTIYIYIFVLAFILPIVCFAQDNTLTTSEGIVVSEEIPIVLEEGIEKQVDISPIPAIISQEPEPWFKIEQLTGGNIQQGDFVVGPGRAEIEVLPGQTVIHEISVANRISDGRVFDLLVEDIGGSGDASDAVVLLGDARGPYTIKDYISFPETSFILKLGERARIPVTITIPPDAEPGGFYGSVLVSTVRTSDGVIESNNAPRSPIIARIGTLFFVTVPGEVNKGGETKELSLTNNKWWYESGPIGLSVLYENTGSVHVNPYGELRIRNLFGEEVGFVELDPWFVLPESLRSRDISWDRELLLGRYVATAYINRGYDDVVDEVSIAFWVLPWKIVGGVFLVVFISLFSMRAFFRKFEFKRKE
jgi:hypothetical protein